MRPTGPVGLPQLEKRLFQRQSTVSSSIDVETDATNGDVEDIDIDLALHNKYH